MIGLPISQSVVLHSSCIPSAINELIVSTTRQSPQDMHCPSECETDRSLSLSSSLVVNVQGDACFKRSADSHDTASLNNNNYKSQEDICHDAKRFCGNRHSYGANMEVKIQ